MVNWYSIRFFLIAIFMIDSAIHSSVTKLVHQWSAYISLNAACWVATQVDWVTLSVALLSVHSLITVSLWTFIFINHLGQAVNFDDTHFEQVNPLNFFFLGVNSAQNFLFCFSFSFFSGMKHFTFLEFMKHCQTLNMIMISWYCDYEFKLFILLFF